MAVPGPVLQPRGLGVDVLTGGLLLGAPVLEPRERVVMGRPRPLAPSGANQVWAIDFVFDACADGRQLECLTVADEFTKEGLAIEVDVRIRSGRVIEVLTRLVSQCGAPAHLRCDSGVLKWIVDQGIGTAFIDPGKPTQNAFVESFIAAGSATSASASNGSARAPR